MVGTGPLLSQGLFPGSSDPVWDGLLLVCLPTLDCPIDLCPLASLGPHHLLNDANDEMCTQRCRQGCVGERHTSGLWQALFKGAVLVHVCVPTNVHTLSGVYVYRVVLKCFGMFHMLQLCEYRHAPCQFSHMHRNHTCVFYTHTWGLHSHMYMSFILWIYIQVLDLSRLIHTAHKNIFCSFTYMSSTGHA
jgi:hypothetical protein